MKVVELINKLSQFDPQMDTIIRFDSGSEGYTYINIVEYDEIPDEEGDIFKGIVIEGCF